MNNSRWQFTFVQGTLILGGVFYILAGAALLFAPRWFLDNVGTFPPYNRHYMGDAGSFALALGVGLMLAVRDPLRHRLLIAVGLVGTLVHMVNHAYGDLVLEELAVTHVLRDLGSVMIYAVLLVIAYVLVWRSPDSR